jgi:hypothetical protein
VVALAEQKRSIGQTVANGAGGLRRWPAGNCGGGAACVRDDDCLLSGNARLMEGVQELRADLVFGSRDEQDRLAATRIPEFRSS